MEQTLKDFNSHTNLQDSSIDTKIQTNPCSSCFTEQGRHHLLNVGPHVEVASLPPDFRNNTDIPATSHPRRTIKIPDLVFTGPTFKLHSSEETTTDAPIMLSKKNLKPECASKSISTIVGFTRISPGRLYLAACFKIFTDPLARNLWPRTGRFKKSFNEKPLILVCYAHVTAEWQIHLIPSHLPQSLALSYNIYSKTA